MSEEKKVKKTLTIDYEFSPYENQDRIKTQAILSVLAKSIENDLNLRSIDFHEIVRDIKGSFYHILFLPWKNKDISQRSDNQDIYRLSLQGIELDYFKDEEDEVLKWAKENFLEVETMPDFLAEEFDFNNIKIGKRLEGYFWTKKVLQWRDSNEKQSEMPI